MLKGQRRQGWKRALNRDPQRVPIVYTTIDVVNREVLDVGIALAYLQVVEEILVVEVFLQLVVDIRYRRSIRLKGYNHIVVISTRRNRTCQSSAYETDALPLSYGGCLIFIVQYSLNSLFY